jgi:hypothetical protein
MARGYGDDHCGGRHGAHGIVLYARLGIDTSKLDEMDGMSPLLVAIIGLVLMPIAGLWALVRIWWTSGDRE